MKLRMISLALMMVMGLITHAKPLQQGFDKGRYYEVIAAADMGAIDKELEVIRNSSVSHKEAYEGVLLMKKAGLIKEIPKKLRLFKSGHSKLETSIEKDAQNAELRFLRIMIQEHAPGIVHYRGNLEKDTQAVKSSFKSLSLIVQKAIIDYSKQSKVISAKDL